ncbi:hypothetical protein MRB53_000364 [Persea americana]|uniref:Uncharacterized protein n=1 Tax=Persea americana TaxID=3435 RepID=A0ACC2MNU4_PERAE|nr:hypothetical protein MRB53_000364 [Persea americana]
MAALSLFHRLPLLSRYFSPRSLPPPRSRFGRKTALPATSFRWSFRRTLSVVASATKGMQIPLSLLVSTITVEKSRCRIADSSRVYMTINLLGFALLG